MLPSVCSIIDHKWRQNEVRTKKEAHEAIAECVTDALTTFWRFLLSITEQTHGNMESICYIYTWIFENRVSEDKGSFYYLVIKSNKIRPKADKKSLYLTPSSKLMVPRSIPMSRSLEWRKF